MCLQNYIILISIRQGRAYLKTQTTILCDPQSCKAGRSFSNPENPKARPALRNAGRSCYKSDSFVLKSEASKRRSPGKPVETCQLEKKRDPRCAKQVALSRGNTPKGVRPALHSPGSSKTSKFMYKSWRNPGRTDLGSWSYWAPISH